MAKGRGRLLRAQEARVENRRLQEAARGELERYYVEQKKIDAYSESENKDDFRRVDKDARERQSEQQILEAMYKAQRARELHALQLAEEEQVSNALLGTLQEEQRRLKEVQRIREDSQELRELAEKLRTARVRREQWLQTQEHQAQVQREREYEAALGERAEQQRLEALAQAETKEMELRQQRVQARHVLEEQIQERQEQQKLAQAQHEEERKMIEQVIDAIEAEDRLEAALKSSKQAETKQFICQFLEESEQRRLARLESERLEERKIVEFQEVKRRREEAAAARLAARKEAADRIYDKLKQEKEEELRQQEEEDRLIDLLREEEVEEKRRKEEESRKQHSAELRASILRANENQQLLKAQRHAAMRAEEDEFRQRMMDKFAEDDRIEQMNAQRRRMKMLEHKREVDRLVQEKRAMFEAQRARDEAEAAARAAEEERTAAIVAAERRRLLAEASDLKDFLPKGVAKDAQELQFIRGVASPPSKH